MSDQLMGSSPQSSSQDFPGQERLEVPSAPGGKDVATVSSRGGLREFRSVLDRLAKALISFGGVAVILSILAIFVFLVLEVFPLFRAPSTVQLAQATLPVPHQQDAVLIGVDEHREVAYSIASSGVFYTDLSTGRQISVDTVVELQGKRITAVARGSGGSPRSMLGTAEGSVIPVNAVVRTRFSATGERTKHPLVTASAPIKIATSPITALAYRSGENGVGMVAAINGQRAVFIHSPAEDDELEYARVTEIPVPDGSITVVGIDEPLLNLYAGMDDGRLHHITLEDPDAPRLLGTYQAAQRGDKITGLGFLLGDRSVVVLTAKGMVSTWGLSRVTPESNRWQLQRMHEFLRHSGTVTAFSASQRDKGFVTGDENGQTFVHYATSEQTLLRLPGSGRAIRALAFAPKADGIVTLDAAGTLILHGIDNPHPEVTVKTLFGKVWYEGYDGPAHVWQSSSGSDDFEPKLGMIPLTFGTLKGTFYALLLAVPIAILAAVFTSHFMHPDLRATIKPTIEVMAALPTVVLGFLAGLWLAPLLERVFPAFMAMLIVIPLMVVGVSLVWRVVPTAIRNHCRLGTEALLLIPVILVGMTLCLWANEGLELWLFDGNFQLWLTEVFGVRYDQRNAVVVGIVMGIAIIPIIYSISEEALSNVPRNLVAGSLALGATRWQTVAHMVVLAASPGIFSAVMIGFGRAIGETMIVLMATGNTPIMDWSMFDGFRTLSANIAVEIPEAPHGGTLYRVLFLAALLLFVMTFMVNTVAEVVRQRLRRKHGHA